MTINNPIESSENEVDEVFAEETGALVIESAIMKYISELEDEEANSFEVYIEANVSQEDFMDALMSKYPRFKEIFDKELAILQTELKAVTEGL